MTPFRLMRRLLLSPRATDAFRAEQRCFTTASFVRTYLEAPRNKEAQRLLRHGFKVYSQNDEDGIIAEIFRRIGTQSRRFVEIGAADGLENNTVWLLLQGWSGTWIEGSPELTGRASQKFASLVGAGRLSVRNEMVTRGTARQFDREGVFADIDLFSLDIDGNDYHIMEAITGLNARVVIVEYNAKFPPPHEFVMKCNESADYSWDLTDYFGASLSSWDQLMRTKGYSLVGCNITGSNAFFVRSDLAAGHFSEPLTPENHYEPARYWLSAGFVSGHPANFGEGHGGQRAL